MCLAPHCVVQGEATAITPKINQVAARKEYCVLKKHIVSQAGVLTGCCPHYNKFLGTQSYQSVVLKGHGSAAEAGGRACEPVRTAVPAAVRALVCAAA